MPLLTPGWTNGEKRAAGLASPPPALSAGRVTVPALPAIAELPPVGRPPARTYRLTVLVGVAGLLVSLLVAEWFRREARQVDAARFQQLCLATGGALEQRVEATEAMLRDLARVFSAKDGADPADWEEFMNQVSPQWNFPGVRALGYATNTTTAATLAALDQWVIRMGTGARTAFYRRQVEFTGDKAWRVQMLDVYGTVLQPREPYARMDSLSGIVGGDVRLRRYSEPASDWERRANGFSWGMSGGQPRLFEHIPDTDVLTHAVLRDEVKITGRLPVLRTTHGTDVVGSTMVVPTYHPRRGEFWKSLTPHQGEPYEPYWLRWHLNQGVVFAHLDFAQLLGHVQGTGPQAIRIEIHASETNAASAATWLNDDGQPCRAGATAFRAAFTRVYQWPMYGGRWTLFFHTTPLFDRQSTRYRAVWAAGSGTLVTLLLCGVLAGQARAQWRDQQLAAELREARDAVQAVQAQRERLSADLHDGAIQSLYAVQLGLSETAREVNGLSPTAARRLRESRASLDGVIAELRRFIDRMGPGRSGDMAEGLGAALRALVERFQPGSAAVIGLGCDPAAEAQLTPDQSVQLAGVAQGALSNAVRHSGARRIAIRLRAEAGVVVLEIKDDGRGFDPAVPSRGLGLATLRRRAGELGAELRVTSHPGDGTGVTVRVPVEAGETPQLIEP